MEENYSDVNQEVVEPGQEEHVSGEVEDHQEQKEVREDPQEKNWRELRQALKELKKENQVLRQEITKPRQQVQEEEDEEVGDEEDLVTNKRLQKALSRIEQKLLEKEKATLEDRLRVKYPDFDEVFTQENVEYLQQNDPELAVSLRALASDPYKQAVAAYKMLKRTDHFMNKGGVEDRAKIAENKTKPTSVQAVRKQGALAEANRFANGLTPELKDVLWKEMQKFSKGS